MKTPATRQAGMSLVELMVGMLIGLIGIVIITHLYLTNEEYKRSTTGAGSAQVNGAVALYTVERDLRMAGFGLNHSGALGCTCAGANCSQVQYYYNGTYSYPPGASGGARPPLVFAPVVITQVAGAAGTITLLYGNAPERSLPGSLQEPAPPTQLTMKIDGTAGYAINDYVVVTQGATCGMVRLTNVVSASQNLERAATSTWNPALGGSTMPNFGNGALLFNLGNPTWRTFSIASNRLQALEVLQGVTGTAALSLVDDIVDLQAQYGRDSNGDGILQSGEWTITTPTSAAEWQQLMAVRFAVLARSPNYVRPAPGTNCDATVAQPTWAGGSFLAKDFTTVTSEDRCYKYRVFETVVPLRNMIWRPA
jgi:type IV pilus assembly protein PilW